MSSWQAITVPSHDVSKKAIQQLVNGEIAALKIPNLIAHKQLKEINERVVALKQTKYEGLEISSLLPICSHWDIRYGKEKTWDHYFEAKPQSEEIRTQVFGRESDPITLIHNLFECWHGDMDFAKLPKESSETHCGRRLYAGLIRGGFPDLHFDWIEKDIKGYRADSQLGWSLYLDSPNDGGNLRIYKKPFWEVDEERTGNYGFSNQQIKNVEQVDVVCDAGDCVMHRSTFLHEVSKPKDLDEKRSSVTVHIAVHSNGNLRLFS